MLLNTSDEALQAKHALMRAREQHISDQLQASQAEAAEERSAAEALRRDRHALDESVAELGSKQRRQACSLVSTPSKQRRQVLALALRLGLASSRVRVRASKQRRQAMEG